NQGYSMDLLKVVSRYYADKMGISVDQLLEPGIDVDPSIFAITRFALNVSRKASGVSQLHSRLSEEYWPKYHWVNVTNAVHFPTWQAASIAQLGTDPDPEQLWSAHSQEKQRLADFVQQQTG